MEAGKVDPKKLAYQFILNNRAGSLATVDSNGLPHVVIVYCIVKKDLSLYFSTRVEGRKFHNLTGQPVVAMAFQNEEDLATIQLMGKAERVEDLAVEQDILHDLILLRFDEPNWPVPPVKLFERGATNELAIIKVTPTEMTFANFETTKTGRYKPFFQKVI